MRETVLCFDFGAGSGRLMAVTLERGQSLPGQQKYITCEEVHRFPNEAVHDTELCWQPQLWLKEMATGLKRAFVRAKEQHWQVLSIGVDTWGADMAYFGADGQLLRAPYCYRSERSTSSIEALHAKVSLAELYAAGGNAYFPFNSIYQLYHDIPLNPQIHSFLFTPDFLLYLLGGEQARRTAEYCIASTSGLCDAQRRNWDWDLIDKVGLPRQIFPAIVEAPCLAGTLAESFGPPVPLLKVASHDTAAAAASIELGADSCFLICGTWFIMGLVEPQPRLGSTAREQGIGNEGAALGGHRVQKTFCGFWLLQRLCKEWSLDYPELAELTMQSTLQKPAEFDVENESLLLPASMEAALRQLLGKSCSRGELLRIVYRSMALACARHLSSLEQLSGKRLTTIHAVGGGCCDGHFMRELQQVCARRIELGAVEASVLGNAALQFLHHQKVADLSEYRSILRQSETVRGSHSFL